MAFKRGLGLLGLHLFDFGAYLDASRVTAGSHIPGTERSSAVTSGHAGAEICIQEEHGGYGMNCPGFDGGGGHESQPDQTSALR